MAISPLKCRTCGKVEWQHICGGLPRNMPKVVSAASVTAPPPKQPAEVADRGGITVPKPKTNRKEYLKLKARERRAAEKAGLTVEQYRAKQKAAAV